jgi:dihydrofolate reductase
MGIVFADQSMSLDGFSAGANVSLDNGLGDGGEALHEWQFRDRAIRTRVVEELFGKSTGAVIVGRRMFDVGEKHWGDNTFLHRPVFVVTHRPQATITKQGGTTYTFVTGGIERVVEQAREAAGDRDVVVLGGATIIRECIRARLLDELRLHLAHIVLGGGTSLFEGLDPAGVMLERTQVLDIDKGVTHIHFRVETTMKRR